MLFNDTFYLRLFGVGHGKGSYSERENPLPPLHGLIFLIISKGSLICTNPSQDAHIMAFVTPVVEHWLEREIAHWRDRSDVCRPVGRNFKVMCVFVRRGGGGWGKNASAAGAKLCKEKRLTPL